MAETTMISVVGMTCEHCVNRVSGEIAELPAVSHVDVDLPTGRVRVESAEPLRADQLRAAVEEAGYALAGE